MSRLSALAALVLAAAPAFAADTAPAPRPAADLSGYRLVADAVRANPKEFTTAPAPAAAGFFGVSVGELGSRVFVEDVAPGSPADKAGVKVGDVIRALNGEPVPTAAAARDILRARLAGDRLTLAATRDGAAVEFAAALAPASRPLGAEEVRPFLDIQLATGPGRGGVRVASVGAGGPADKAGVKAGDVVLRLDDDPVTPAAGLRPLLANRRPGDAVTLTLDRGGKTLDVVATLAATPATEDRQSGWDDRLPRVWTRPDYKLAIIGIEYPDVKHNPKVTGADWEASLFSRHSYTGRSATGQPVQGSMADYYAELSRGAFKPEGKFVGWVEVSKKRTDYSTGSGTSSREKTSLLTETLDKLLAKNKDALKGFDGVFFLYAGGRMVETTRGGLYWPHRSTITHAQKRWPYFIVQEGGPQMTNISVFCHEFGHMLGLPDLYARPENPGSEGAGVWCAMANQVGLGRPQHFSAWCKEQLGWARPVVIDPRVKQKLILPPVEDAGDCLKVMVRTDGSEYFLLENRRKQGWDKSLPAEGLLIWRVVNGRPILEESHGVEGAAGPRVHLGSVPYPSAANDSFTPFTTPSSRSQLGGGLPVYLTSVRKLPDGRITLHVGYEYQ